MPRHASRFAALALGCLITCACGAQPPRPTPTPLPPTATPRPTLAPTPTAAPTETPVPRLPLRVGVQLDPQRPSVGEEFILRLTVVNPGDRPAKGVYIATTGRWDRYTILGVAPRGNIARDAAGWHIVSPTAIPPGTTYTLEVRARAEEPSDERLTFSVREAEPGDL